MKPRARTGIALLGVLFLLAGCFEPPKTPAPRTPADEFRALWEKQNAQENGYYDYAMQVAGLPNPFADLSLRWIEHRVQGSVTGDVSYAFIGNTAHLKYYRDAQTFIQCTEGGFYGTRVKCRLEDANANRTDPFPLAIVDAALKNNAEIQYTQLPVFGTRPCRAFRLTTEAVERPHIVGLEEPGSRRVTIETCLDTERGFINWLEARETLDANTSEPLLKMRLVEFAPDSNESTVLPPYPFTLESYACADDRVEVVARLYRRVQTIQLALLNVDQQLLQPVEMPIQVEPFFEQTMVFPSDLNADVLRVCEPQSRFCQNVLCQ